LCSAESRCFEASGEVAAIATQMITERQRVDTPLATWAARERSQKPIGTYARISDVAARASTGSACRWTTFRVPASGRRMLVTRSSPEPCSPSCLACEFPYAGRTHWRTGWKLLQNRHVRESLENRFGRFRPTRVQLPPLRSTKRITAGAGFCLPNQVYVFAASLVGVPGVRRTIAVRSDQTLVDLHDALQHAFEWDDDHLYSFWLDGTFWSRAGDEYAHPWHAAEPGPLAPFGLGPEPQSAEVRLDRLELTKGKRIAYLFDFGDEWRVRLTLQRIADGDGGAYPRLVKSVGAAPPQYPDYEEFEDVA
jgi:hypothetical protein